MCIRDRSQDVLTIIEQRAKDRGIQMQFRAKKEDLRYPFIYGSPVHLRQIFLNIYGNCIKYNRIGGKIITVSDYTCLLYTSIFLNRLRISWINILTEKIWRTGWRIRYLSLIHICDWAEAWNHFFRIWQYTCRQYLFWTGIYAWRRTGLCNHGSVSVSYTHLDVYKRQAIPRRWASACSMQMYISWAEKQR